MLPPQLGTSCLFECGGSICCHVNPSSGGERHSGSAYSGASCRKTG